MKQLSNQSVDTLVKVLPVLIDNIDMNGKPNKVINAVRIARKVLKQLNKIQTLNTNNHGGSSKI